MPKFSNITSSAAVSLLDSASQAMHIAHPLAISWLLLKSYTPAVEVVLDTYSRLSTHQGDTKHSKI